MTTFRLLADDRKQRSPDWIELFFDLAFVVCIASLSHGLVFDSSLKTLATYAAFFVPVWWVWNQFTWYSSHFNNGDPIFRAFMFAGAAGSLAMASSFSHSHIDHTRFVAAYVFLHVILMAGWIRAYKHVTEIRPYIMLKIAGQSCGIILWTISLACAEETQAYVWFAAVVLQLLTPVLATAALKNQVHLKNLTERHGLFTIIVLGECCVSIVNRLQKDALGLSTLYCALDFLIVVALWWVYSKWDSTKVAMTGIQKSIAYNYGHCFLFASLGLLSAGIALGDWETILFGCATFVVVLSSIELITKREAAETAIAEGSC